MPAPGSRPVALARVAARRVMSAGWQHRTSLVKRVLTAKVKTYEAEVGSILGGVLSPEEQQQMSDYVSRLLTSIDQGEGT